MPELRWYAIQTTARHENKVRNLVARRIAEDARAELRERLRAVLPIRPDGSIHLIARAWAVRGSKP